MKIPKGKKGSRKKSEKGANGSTAQGKDAAKKAESKTKSADPEKQILFLCFQRRTVAPV
jgi:hypothetical protein